MKTYALIYNNELGTRDEIKEFLDKRPEIVSWRYDLPNAFYLLSNKSADELYRVLDDGLRTNKKSRLLICELNTENTQGWLPKETWTFLARSG